MCTQNGHAAARNKDHSGHVNRRYRQCDAASDIHNRNELRMKRAGSESRSHSGYSLPAAWFLKLSCYNAGYSARYTEVRCSLEKYSVSSVKCRHIICLLLAYFAVSVSAEAATSADVTTTVSSWPHTSRPQHLHVPVGKNASIIPLPESQTVQEDEQKVLANSAISVTTSAQNNNTVNKTKIALKDLKHQVTKSVVDDASNNISEEESRYFIFNLFHRYSDNDYLLRADFETLVAHIGLGSALNSSESYFRNNENKNRGDSHKHSEADNTQHDHKQTGSGNLKKDDEGFNHKTGHDSFNTTIESYPTIADLHQRQSSSEKILNDTTVAIPRGRHSQKVASHQYEEHNKCLSVEELLLLFRYDKLNRLNADNFLHLCPALVDQLDAGYCKQEVSTTDQDLKDSSDRYQQSHKHQHGGHEVDGDHHHTDGHKHDHGDRSINEAQEEHERKPVPPEVWFYAVLSVAVISLCSVAGVVVIPNMKRVFYNHVLQFLVALAVGAMSADSMLHLLPHALLSESHHGSHQHQHHVENETDTDHSHNHDGEDGAGEMSSHMSGLYKGLVALLGIYSFFFLERLFTLFTRNRNNRSERKQRRRRHSRDEYELSNQTLHMMDSKLENDGGNTPSCDDMVMVVHPNKALRAYADVSHEAYLHRCDDAMAQSLPNHDITTVLSIRDQRAFREESLITEGIASTGLAAWNKDRALDASSDAEIIGISKDVEPVKSTHSHSHSHLTPDFVGPLSSVATMVIVGDMIHNFCDGLAIGAAYAESVAGGLSTSVAVFCHELPHEIGDFAVLVRSGLTMKKAVYFNLVSSIPCFGGVIIGLAIGNVEVTSSWIFAGVGGMFLYITLVDLIPEMSSVYTKCGEPWFLHLLLQASGIAMGTTIMLIISVYEESLLKAFN